jgi:Glu-tRNA(Gln) amidotransferase subunit E-like FAD-binding protein
MTQETKMIQETKIDLTKFKNDPFNSFDNMSDNEIKEEIRKTSFKYNLCNKIIKNLKQEETLGYLVRLINKDGKQAMSSALVTEILGFVTKPSYPVIVFKKQPDGTFKQVQGLTIADDKYKKCLTKALNAAKKCTYYSKIEKHKQLLSNFNQSQSKEA